MNVSYYLRPDPDPLNVTRSVDGRVVYERGYQYDLAGNRLAMTSPWWEVSYVTNNNRMVSWSLDLDGSTIAAMDVHGHASETIGSPSVYTNQSVSNIVAVTPSVDGTNFVAYAVPFGSGTQQVVAAIADAAGNIGMTTSSVQIAVVTNATYGYTTASCVSNAAYSGTGITRTLDLAWDAHYRLTSVMTNGVTAESYQYNAHGLRVSTTDAGGEKRWHVYDSNHPIAEVSTNGTLMRSYIWGPGIDNLVSYTDYTESETNTYYALTDQLGTVHALADETGALVESYDYDAWGRVLGVYDGNGTPLGESAVGNHYLWQGRWYSWDTGLYYFRARWYDPITGRWLSKDPIGISGGLNQYVFCGNNPVNGRDPMGLWNIWNSATWGVANGAGWNWYDSLNPFHESGAMGATGMGASMGAAAALDGIIPLLDPLKSAYTDECGNYKNGTEWSKRLGAMSRDLYLMSGGGMARPKSFVMGGAKSGTSKARPFFEAILRGAKFKSAKLAPTGWPLLNFNPATTISVGAFVARWLPYAAGTDLANQAIQLAIDATYLSAD